MPAARLEAVRFVFDEDSRGFGLHLSQLRTDMACIGSRPLASDLPSGTKDPDWIPVLADHGWIAITQNAEIRTHPIEGELARAHGLRVACLMRPEGRGNRWDATRQLLRSWERIEQLMAAPGPGWLSIYWSRTRLQTFEPGKIVRARPHQL